MREQVVEDWKVYTACGLAAEQAEKLAARAREVGLAAAVAEATDLKALLTSAAQAATQPAGASSQMPPYVTNLEPYTPKGLTRNSRTVERLGFITSVQDAIFGLAEASAGEPATAHRVTVMSLANQFKWVIGELEEIKPIYAGDFEQQVPYGMQAVQRSDMRTFGMAWHDPERVQQRTGFTSAWKSADPEQPEAP